MRNICVMKGYFTCLLAWFCFCSLMAQSNGLLSTVPLKIKGKHVLVKVSVNNQEAVWFVFDSGASHNMIDGQYAQEIGLDGTDSTWVAGFGGKKRTAQSKGNELRIGESVTTDMALTFVKNLDPSGLIKGYLGGSFLRQKVVAVDYQKRLFSVYDSQTFEYTGQGEQLYADHRVGVPAVQSALFLNGDTLLNGWFFIDTGASASVLCNPWVEKEFQCISQFDKTHEVKLSGYGGGFSTIMGRSDSLHIGQLSIPGVPIQMQVTSAPLSPSSHTYYGFIGADILGRCKVYFDYQRLRLILEPNNFFSAPFRVKPGGFTMGYNHQTNQVVIDEVVSQTACAIAGLQTGDVLLVVNGINVSRQTMPQIMQELMKMEQQVNMTVERAGMTQEVNFVIEDVV